MPDRRAKLPARFMRDVLFHKCRSFLIEEHTLFLMFLKFLFIFVILLLDFLELLLQPRVFVFKFANPILLSR